MVQIRCKNFDKGCPFADGEPHDADSLDDFRTHRCDVLAAGGQCTAYDDASPRQRGGGGSRLRIPRPVLIAIAAIVGLAAVGAAAFYWIPRGARCDVAQVRAMMKLDPKVGELEASGLSCLKAGEAKGDSDMLFTAILALRTASDKGSSAASAMLGRLFDPLVRPDLEQQSKTPQLLPTPDPAIAVGFYDKAKDDPDARAAAARLRSKYPELAAEASNRDGSPLTMPGYEGLYQRALVKPGAMLVNAPGAGGGMPLSMFDIVYVFGVKPGWRRVGHTLESGAEGWVSEASLQNWNVALVMRYAPQGARNPVLFFKDETAAKGVLLDVNSGAAVAALVKSVHDGKSDERLTAIEEQSVDWASTPFMMPILRTTPVTADDGRTIYLAEVGSVAGLAKTATATAATTTLAATGGTTIAGGGAHPAYCKDRSLPGSVSQIVFVIDTTESMGPYIEGVRRIADQWRDEISRRNIAQKFRFGVVAYRNNMDTEPQKSRLEYVSRTALPLSPTSDAAMLAATVGALKPASVSTRTVDEDPVAGLDDALSLDWSQGCGLRAIFLVSDAGALNSDDPRSKHVGTGLSTIAARAREMNIDIFPVHLHTPEARRANDIESAMRQYRSELDTANGLNYRSIPQGSPAEFGKYLDQVSVLVNALDEQSKGGLVARPTNAGTIDKPIAVSDMILGKLFAVQQRFLGAMAGASAPTFASSWTSDKDMGNLNLPALEVSVFLSRRQLNRLASKTDYLLRTAQQAKTESSRFFGLLSMVSAATAQDPQRFAGDNTDLGALMPSFLRILPYKSDVLALSAADWRAMGPSKQNDFIRRLGEKLTFYKQLEADQSRWVALGSTDKDEAVALVPLKQLP